ncbi:hypothetical protein O181_031570 [Austropuccinia psidii MF-1]|uniref:Peptidase S8/S53 domain-containing protein n=1 Tax=Austropuccinia psidii MF-1 TaxID=1389203 RepID=A0A9Q3CZC4_9BASI|nr:hypothetical protein [Austropuccinia psidii MF-1]
MSTSPSNRFLVTLSPKYSPSLQDFSDHLNSKGIGHRILLDITYQVPEVFFGVSLELENRENISLLGKLSHVERVNPVRLISPSRTFNRGIIEKPIHADPFHYPPHLEANVTLLHKMGIYGEGVKVALIDSGIECQHPALGKGFGKGYKIGFGMSLVDDDDDDDGGADGKKKKHDKHSLPLKQAKVPSPCTPCSTHGTHVAGIVGASDAGYGFTGVAPNVTLGMYRVFGCGDDPHTTEDLILAAMLHAHKDGGMSFNFNSPTLASFKDDAGLADIISASVGDEGGWGYGSALIDTINKLVEKKGAIIVVAAGNEGSEGLFYADSPSSAKDVISVGSVDSEDVIAGHFKASTGKNLTIYRTKTIDAPGSYPIYFTSGSFENSRDACDELPKNTPDLSRYVVLIKRGTCLFSLKVQHAKKKGAKRILFYMVRLFYAPYRGIDSDSVSLIASLVAKPVWNIPQEFDEYYCFGKRLTECSGRHDISRRRKISSSARQERSCWFQNLFSKNRAFLLSLMFNLSFIHSLKLTSCSPALVPNPDGGFPSSYSQYGPAFDFQSPQPAVSAIGANVVSTFPLKEGSYGSLSGTSMATPQIAGIAALVLSVRGKNFTGLTMRNRLASTTQIMQSSRKDHTIDTVVHQGGGLINAFCAVFANTTLSTPSLSLNDSAFYKGHQTFTISNHGSQIINYKLNHVTAKTLKTFSYKSKFHRPDADPAIVRASASAKINPQTFTLKPGSSQTINVDVKPPTILDPKSLAVYSGFIVLHADFDCESHNLPYYGILGSMKAHPILDRGPDENHTIVYPYLSFQNSSNSDTSTRKVPAPQTLNSTFVWDFAKHKVIYLRFRSLFGSPLFRADVIPGNSTLSSKSKHHDYKNYFKGIRLTGLVPDSETESFSRSSVDSTWVQAWNATIMTNKSHKPHRLPNGTYKLLLRALRVTGRRENEEDFDYWISPKFHLRN